MPEVVQTETLVVRVKKLLDKNKALAAVFVPLLTAVGAATASWIVSGDFNATEIRAAAGGTVLSLIAGASAYLTPSKAAEVEVTTRAAAGPLTPTG